MRTAHLRVKYLRILMRLFAGLAILAVLAGALMQTSAAPNPAAETPAVESFIFAAAGDHENGSKAVASLDSIALSGADFYLALGDMSYDNVNPESMWCDLVKAHVGATFPFELLAGNHEDHNFDGLADGLIENYAACLPDRLGTVVGEYSREYYFDYPATNPLARFILISPDLTFTNSQHYVYAVGTTHYDWLSNTIDSARTANIPWVVVGMHKVCITVGTKSCDIGTDLMNLLISKRVDLVLQAHDHGYQRSKQLSCFTVNSYNPACVSDDSTDNSYIQGNGPVFVIAGMFGVTLYTFNAADSEAGYFATWMAANQNLTNGYMKYIVSDAAIVAQFVDTSGGGYSDNFTITNSLVTLTPSQTLIPSPTLTPTLQGVVTISSQVGASADDAEEAVSNGSVDLTSSDLELSVDRTINQWVGLRFANITVPKGATVLNAHVEFEVDETGSDPTSLTILGQAADNALAFTTAQNDVSGRARTSAQVAWNNVPAWTVVDAKWQTPDLATIVQEIVNRPGWTPGNAVAIIISGSGRRTAEAYDGEIPAAARLVITYINGTPTTVPSSTPTWTATPSHTPTPTHTATAPPTVTYTATATDTPTSSETPTETLTPLPTETATPSPLPTDTPTASPTPAPSYTATFTATDTPLPSNTPTPTATFTASFTPTATATWTATPTSTATLPVTYLFTDGFESGNFSAWTTVVTGIGGSASVQGTTVNAGGFAARFLSTNASQSKAYARKNLTSVEKNVTVSGVFMITQEGTSNANVPIFRLYDAAGKRLLTLYRQNLSSNRVYVTDGSTRWLAGRTMPLNTWVKFDLHVIIAGNGMSTIEVSMDGVQAALTTTANLGTGGVYTLQIGNDTTKQIYTLFADDIVVRK